MQGEITDSEPKPQPERRRIEFSRRTCTIRPERVDVRPSSGAILPPLIGFVFGAICVAIIFAALALWPGRLPFVVLAILLLLALLCLPVAGMGLVYALFGANVLIDRRKQSATWQQGLLGLGIGTVELVPFWKIEAIVVEEAGAEQKQATEEVAQWEISLLKQSGKRLSIGRLNSARAQSEYSLARAIDVAQAISSLTGAPLRLPDATPSTSLEPMADKSETR